MFPACLPAHLSARLQFVSLVRVIRWVWLLGALIGILLGAILLGVGDQAKPKTVVERSTYSSRYTYSHTTGDQGAYATMVALGVIFLLAGKCRRHSGTSCACMVVGGVTCCSGRALPSAPMSV